MQNISNNLCSIQNSQEYNPVYPKKSTKEESSEQEESDRVSIDFVEEEIEITSTWDSKTIAFYGPDTRSITLSGPVDELLTTAITGQIYLLASMSTEPIQLWINTPGGSVVDALSIYDTIRLIDVPVVGIVSGGCYSAGLIILSACDVRLSTPNSMFYYHQPVLSGGEINSTESAKSILDHYFWSQKTLDKLIRETSEIPKKIWKKKFKNSTSTYFTAEEALKWGFIDKIMEYADKGFEEE